MMKAMKGKKKSIMVMKNRLLLMMAMRKGLMRRIK